MSDSPPIVSACRTVALPAGTTRARGTQFIVSWMHEHAGGGDSLVRGSTPSGWERKEFGRGGKVDWFLRTGGIDGVETASACDVKGSHAPGVRALGKRGDGTERDHHAGQDPAGREMQ